MRVLFLTNFYPPVSHGGYERWCQEVAEGLAAGGHTVSVLTTRGWKERVQAPEPPWVHRLLHMEMEFSSLVHGVRFFAGRQKRERQNLETLRRLVEEFRPDLIFIWGMWNLPRSLPALAEALMPERTVYYLADYWPTLPSQHEYYWNSPGVSRATRLPKRVLRPLALRMLARQAAPELHFRRAIFPTRFLRDELRRGGLQVGQASVILGAIDARRFAAPGSEAGEGGESRPLSLLAAGRLSPEKGLETAIDAVERLARGRGPQAVRLTIVGGGERGYVQSLHSRVQVAGLEEAVTFMGTTPQDEMPDLYQKFDAFLFTSTWQEPFGRVLVEAMASGLVVIGTGTGGAGEILAGEENALLFEPGDAAGLAAQIARLIDQPGLRRALAEKGRQTALEKFDMPRMVQEIEACLQQILCP